MSCSVPSKLLTYYSNKINIYDNESFIPLPDWNSCPPPSQIYIMPEFVYPSAGPYIPPVIVPVPPPLYYPGAYCGPCNSASSTTPCGPCGK
jgi:hypothetical protein